MGMLEKGLMENCKILQAESSKLGKEELLKKWENNVEFKKYLKCVLDSLNVYGLQDKKIKKFLGRSTEGRGNADIFKVFDYLSKNNTGTDKDAALVARFIDSFEDEEMKQFLLESFTKKIRLGATASTVNKVYGKGFITKFDVMLAHPYEKHADKLEGKEFAVTEKFDGMRVFSYVEDGVVKLFTRDGKLKTGFTEIESELVRLPNGCYDGEMISANHEALSDRAVLQETLKTTQSKGEKTGLVFIMFDYVSLEDFKNGESKLNYNERQSILNERITGFKHLQVADVLYQGKDASKIVELVADMDKRGREGVMVNVVSAPYEFKRTHNLLKVKTMQSADLRVIGFELGKPMSKYANTLGTLIVDYKGYQLGVGGGFTDSQRDEIWSDQDKYIGKIAEIQYFRESQNESGGLSVSFPIFKTWRFDKDEPSYY